MTRIKLPPFIVTLGMLSVFTAISLIYAQGQTIQLNPGAFLLWTGNTFAIGSLHLTYGVLLMLVVYVVFAYALRFTAWGRHLYAVGDDAEAARLAGIRVNRVLLSAYVVAGFADRGGRLGPRRPRRRRRPQQRAERQPGVDHRGGHRRHQPVRRPRRR